MRRSRGVRDRSRSLACTANARITTTGNDVGGLVGMVLGNDTQISACSSSGGIESAEYGGGLVGYSQAMSSTAARRNRLGTNLVGGLCGVPGL